MFAQPTARRRFLSVSRSAGQPVRPVRPVSQAVRQSGSRAGRDGGVRRVGVRQWLVTDATVVAGGENSGKLFWFRQVELSRRACRWLTLFREYRERRIKLFGSFSPPSIGLARRDARRVAARPARDSVWCGPSPVAGIVFLPHDVGLSLSSSLVLSPPKGPLTECYACRFFATRSSPFVYETRPRDAQLRDPAGSLQ